jgi:hypothetical protein
VCLRWWISTGNNNNKHPRLICLKCKFWVTTMTRIGGPHYGLVGPCFPFKRCAGWPLFYCNKALYWLVPCLDHQCKTNTAQRQKCRTQHLRDTLADLFLVPELERHIMIQYQGNRSHELQAIDRMRRQVLLFLTRAYHLVTAI